MLKECSVATILIVDDDKINSMMLEERLSSCYNMLIAHSGSVALLMAEQHLPDLILLDIEMPGMSGFDVFSQLKSNQFTQNIPIIFVTGRDQAEDEVRGLEYGAVDYITKPFVWEIVCSRVKTQVELKRKTDLLESYVHVDGLTSIANRRRFDDFLFHEWNRAARSAKEISLIMMDVDFFKHYNDCYGHSQGDDCLIRVAACLQLVMKRAVDLVARYGGEEFVAVLPATDKQGALLVAERIRAAVESLNIAHEHSDVASCVTLSLGVACLLPSSGEDASTLINAADTALYKAKESGRNQVKS